MQKRTQFFVFIGILMLLLGSINLYFIGCASTSPQQLELTPEQQKAIQDSLVKIHEGKIRLKFSFGYEPYKQGDYQKAKRYFKEVAELDTGGIYGRVLYQRLGDCYLRLNLPDSAEWAYRIGIERLPNLPYFYEALGYIYRPQGRTDEAIEMYETLTKLVPDSVNYHRFLAQLYINTDETDKAIGSYQAIVRLDPTDQRSQEILSSLLAQTGDIEMVIESQKGLVERDPENMRYRMDLAQTYYRTSEFELAIEQFLVVTSKETDNIQAFEMLGDSYQQIEKFRDALNIYKQILQSTPDDKKNLCNLAICHVFLGNYRLAVNEVRKALRIDSNYGLAYLTRGMAYEASADKCVAEKGGTNSFDDKLVYKLAYDEFVKAKRDLEWKTDAERRMAYVESLIPTREDIFMHKDQKTPRGACYQWIE